MAKNKKLKLNRSGMAELLKDDEIRELTKDAAMNVLSEAIRTAPVKTGSYRDSLHMAPDETDRTVWRIRSDAPHAHLIEARTGHLAKSLGS